MFSLQYVYEVMNVNSLVEHFYNVCVLQINVVYSMNIGNLLNKNVKGKPLEKIELFSILPELLKYNFSH